MKITITTLFIGLTLFTFDLSQAGAESISNPVRSQVEAQEATNTVFNFLAAMRAQSDVSPFLSRKFLEDKNVGSSGSEYVVVNSYLVEEIRILDSSPPFVDTMIISRKNNWAHKLKFKVVKENGRVLIVPSGIENFFKKDANNLWLLHDKNLRYKIVRNDSQLEIYPTNITSVKKYRSLNPWWSVEQWADIPANKNASTSSESRNDKSCNPPAGEILRYSDHCINGACIRTFQNGCKKRFQAPYCYDLLQGRWEWKPEGC